MTSAHLAQARTRAGRALAGGAALAIVLVAAMVASFA
jgi:hypothetical protein